MRGDETTEVYLNLLSDGRRRHKNANLTVDGWETDANILAVISKAGEPVRQFIAHGSYLRHDGKVYFDSFSKEFVVIEGNQRTVYRD